MVECHRTEVLPLAKKKIQILLGVYSSAAGVNNRYNFNGNFGTSYLQVYLPQTILPVIHD
jgi:hypothetical protein